MATDTAVKTVTIDGADYQLRPPTDDSHVDQTAWLDEDDEVVESWADHLPVDAEEIRTYGIECVARVLDAYGTTVGFMCPSCEQPVLLQHTDHYRDGYRGCPRLGCDTVVYCGDVLGEN